MRLTDLPPCPIQSCSKCGRDDGGWISAKYGCAVCAPEMEEIVSRISALVSRVELLEGAIQYIHKATFATGSVSSGGIKRVLRNHALVELVESDT